MTKTPGSATKKKAVTKSAKMTVGKPIKKPVKSSAAAVGERAEKILAALIHEYPEPRCALSHGNAYELLVATILSAQCTDLRVNLVTPEVFRRFPDPRTLAGADSLELEALVRSTGFYRNKSKSLLGAADRMVRHYGGEVPGTMEDLLTLPGVARKTANVILGTWFGKNEGVVVDTHVHRLSHRLRLTRHDDPVKIEQDLMGIFPREEWTDLSHRLIAHGRRVCQARSPRCRACVLGPLLCLSYEPDPARWRARATVKKSSSRGK